MVLAQNPVELWLTFACEEDSPFTCTNYTAVIQTTAGQFLRRWFIIHIIHYTISVLWCTLNPDCNSSKKIFSKAHLTTWQLSGILEIIKVINVKWCKIYVLIHGKMSLSSFVGSRRHIDTLLIWSLLISAFNRDAVLDDSTSEYFFLQ